MADVILERIGGSLTGTLGDKRVDLQLHVPASRAGIRGTCANVSLGGYWHIESNADTPDPVALFLGDYDGTPVLLRNEVHLTHRYALSHADLTGSIADQKLRARIASVEAPAHGPAVLGIDGQFDGQTITVYVAAETDLSGIRIDGVIGAQSVKLDITSGSIRGHYTGPDVLFPLFACPPLYFL